MLIARYATTMTDADWQPSTVMLCAYDGEFDVDLWPGRYLINGRNRLAAVIESGLPQLFVIEHHVTTNAGDVHHLYQVQDRGRTRTVADIFRSIGLDEELGLSISDLRWLSQGHALIAVKFTRRKPGLTDPFARADFVRDWMSECLAWRACVRRARPRIQVTLGASPITAMALYLLRHQRGKAEPFLTDLCADDGLQQGTPVKTLHDWIMDHRVQHMDLNQYCRAIASAWNAVYAGVTLDRILVRERDDLPINILGTPLAHRVIHRNRRKIVAGEEPNDTA
jgi:hypothetical protein